LRLGGGWPCRNTSDFRKPRGRRSCGNHPLIPPGASEGPPSSELGGERPKCGGDRQPAHGPAASTPGVPRRAGGGVGEGPAVLNQAPQRTRQPSSGFRRTSVSFEDAIDRTTTELAVWVARYDIPVSREIDNPPTAVERRSRGAGLAAGLARCRSQARTLETSALHKTNRPPRRPPLLLNHKR
jgi:hypothetical protein